MNHNGFLDLNLLEDYLDGKLDEKAMHQVEKLSLEDPFVAEALAGLSQSALRSQSLSLLQKRLHDRVAQKPIEIKRWAITSQRLSIASAAAVLFIVVSVLFWMKENSRRQLESNQAKNIKVEILPNNTLATVMLPPTKTELQLDKTTTVAKTNTGIKQIKEESKSVELLPAVASATVVVAEDDQSINGSSKAVARMSSTRILNAEPVDGWAKFEEYIILNNKLIQNKNLGGKSVQLSFRIEQNNRPTTIKVVSGLTKAENEEAMRLLVEGPDWKYSSDQTGSVIVNIKF